MILARMSVVLLALPCRTTSAAGGALLLLGLPAMGVTWAQHHAPKQAQVDQGDVISLAALGLS